MSEPTITVTWLTGVKELKPVEYTLVDHGDGTGRLECEYSAITGDLRDLKMFETVCGQRIAHRRYEPIAVPRRWWLDRLIRHWSER